MTSRPLLTRELLEGMKRSDLQRVCKERGLKANLKTEAMIELLLDSPSQSPRRPSRNRVASASTRAAGRQISTQSRLRSTTSMIVHSDTEEDEDHNAVKPESEALSGLNPGPMTRTRKARDAQLRLGVGRPPAAAGRGPRTVTRSVSVKRARSRSGRGAKPASTSIVEGTPEGAPPPPSNPATPPPRTSENGRIHRASTADTSSGPAGIRAIVEEQVRPLQRTVASLQRQLQQQASTHARELVALSDRVMTVMNELRELHRHAESIQLLRSSIEHLQTELSRIQQGQHSEPSHDPTNFSISTSTPPEGPSHATNVGTRRSIEPTRNSRPPRSSPAFEYPPPPAGSPAKPPSRDVPMQTSILGKRQRSTDACDTTAVLETDQEESRTGIHRQSRKRAKMEQLTDDASNAPLAGPSNTAVRGQSEDTVRDGPPSEIAVSRQPDTPPTTAVTGRPSRDHVVGDIIFTDRDFDFFDNPSSLHLADSQLNPSQEVETRQTFSFAFPGVAPPPVTPTPAPTAPLPNPSSSPALSTIPYPERPHSPSPAPVPHRTIVTRPLQNDAYRPFGFPPESRNPTGSSATHGSAIDPASLLRTPPQSSHDMLSDSEQTDGRRRASSNDVGAGLGMTSLPMRVEDTPAATVRRTMYGTELEGDTRFGDFGIEGVAAGFWSGSKF